jgi:hypothetical protein
LFHFLSIIFAVFKYKATDFLLLSKFSFNLEENF